METYVIEGNHPIFKYVNLIANGESDLHNKMHELLANGYEIITRVESAEQTNKPESMGNILRLVIDFQTKK